MYVTCHLKSPCDGWERENAVLEDLYKCLDKYHVTKDEMERATEKYLNIKLFQRNGFKECMENLKNFGKKKKLLLFTRESSESAKAAKNYFNNFDETVSNVTKYHSDGTINGVNLRMKTPEDRLKVLEEVSDLKQVLMISNNKGDRVCEGKVGMFIPFSKKAEKGKIHIKDFREFSKQLERPD